MMAAHSNNFIRVRLLFEYPPPATADCRMCWLLVDLNRCRVVSDLEGLIREKFEFSRRSILNLFIDDCYLPHTESVYVVRDNDSVRVKVDHLAPVNGHISSPVTDGESCRKRQRPAEEDGVGETLKKKKKKKRSEGSQERDDGKQADGGESNTKSQEKHKEKKKRKEVPAVTPKPLAPTKKTPTSVEQPVKIIKKLPAKPQKASSSDSSSSSSSEDEVPKKKASQKPAPKTSSSTPAASKVTQNTKKKAPPPSSSSSETSSDEAASAKNPLKKKLLNSAIPKKSVNAKPQQAPPSPQTATKPAQKPSSSAALAHPSGKPARSSSSDSEEEIQLVIRRPVQPAQQLGRGLGIQSPGRGRGRGMMRGGGPAERGRGEGRGNIRGHNNSFEFNYNGATEPTYQTDSLTNMSVVIQNRTESVPKKDYSSMPLLAAPPQAGQKIAFKLLELTENYTPEVSEYKEGRIVSFDLTTNQVELNLLCSSQAPVEPGKFDLVYQNPDGSERVEYAVSRGSRVTERWDSLLEPRLII
ncbi:coilin [Labrus bergylta]|uniref:coilin n=1 Tax=Labrus bergylta TaxID=56723 RepID=UPI003313805B